jgi:heat shock protein HslJ
MTSQRFTTRGLRSFAVMLAIGLAVSACAGTGPDASSGGSSTAADAVVGTWGDTAQSKPHLVLSNDGQVEGSDGCNGISTTYAVDGTTLTFERFVSTRKACVGVDTWLSEVRHAEVDGDDMVITNAKGEYIGTLTRTAD